MDTLSLNTMNTNFYIEIAGTQKNDWKDKVVKWLQYVAREWSRFEPNNELNQINQLKVGEIGRISPALYDCLKEADNYYTLTNNIFSPYLKLHLEQHGYDRSFPFQESKYKPIQIEKKANKPFLFLDHNEVLKTDNQLIDLGGFAKGYVVEKIADWLRQVSPEFGIVDGGGDMKMWSSGKKTWTIGIAHPFHIHEEISTIRIQNGAIATSNRIFRSWKQQGKEKHHLLDGRTGEVIISPILQTTIITNSLCQAEVATKLAFLLNEQELQVWFDKLQIPCACLIAKDDGSIYWLKGGEKLDVI